MYIKKIASLEIYNNNAYIQPTLNFIDGIVATSRDYDVTRYSQLRFIVTEMIRRRIERAYPGREGKIYVELFIRDSNLEVSVRDMGVPEWIDFSYQEDEITTNKFAFLKFLVDRFIDSAGVEKLGKEGQRYYVRQQIKNPLKFRAPKPYQPIEVLDTNITIRPVKTEKDAIEAIRCIYSEYGYSYAYEKLYYVDNFLRMVKSGQLMSFLAVNEHGQTAGHFALAFSDLFENMPELSTVVTRKEFRNLGLFAKFIDHSMDLARRSGFRAIMGQPVGFHPMSQKAFLRGGFTATSLLLSYVDGETQSEYNLNRERMDLFACVKMVDPNAQCSLYPPKQLWDFVDGIYTKAGYQHKLMADAAPAESTRISYEENGSLKMKRVLLQEAGADLKQLLKSVVGDSIRKKHEMIELFISLRSASCDHGYTTAKDCDFVLSGILPGAANDDYLVMQMLLKTERHYDQLVTVGEFETLTNEIIRLTDD